MIGLEIRDHLLSGAQVVAKLGQRIFMQVMRQDTPKPAAAITVVSDVPTNTLCGHAGLSNARIQVDVYAATTAAKGGYMLAHEAADEIELRLRVANAGFSCLCLGRVEDYDDTVEEYHVRMDFSVWRKS